MNRPGTWWGDSQPSAGRDRQAMAISDQVVPWHKVSTNRRLAWYKRLVAKRGSTYSRLANNQATTGHVNTNTLRG